MPLEAILSPSERTLKKQYNNTKRTEKAVGTQKREGKRRYLQHFRILCV